MSHSKVLRNLQIFILASSTMNLFQQAKAKGYTFASIFFLLHCPTFGATLDEALQEVLQAKTARLESSPL